MNHIHFYVIGHPGLVHKVGSTKNRMKVQKFQTPISISSFITVKHYSVSLGPRVPGIDSQHALVLSPDVLSEHLTK